MADARCKYLLATPGGEIRVRFPDVAFAHTAPPTRAQPVQPDHPFWTKLFHRSTISVQLCNFGWTGWAAKYRVTHSLLSLRSVRRHLYQSTPNRIWRRFHASALSVPLTVRFREATKLEFRARGGRAPGGQVGQTGYITSKMLELR